MMIYDFAPESDLQGWFVVDDGVMGGRSQGGFGLSEDGHGLFAGEVSLENNGGFSSVRYSFRSVAVEGYRYAVLRVKGDGKRYQFRAKSSANQGYSYVAYFETTGEWETIRIPLQDMYPTFRGMRLPRENYDAQQLGEIAFLISNKKAEAFRVEIDWIRLETDHEN